MPLNVFVLVILAWAGGMAAIAASSMQDGGWKWFWYVLAALLVGPLFLKMWLFAVLG